jgi:hypothetical protein
MFCYSHYLVGPLQPRSLVVPWLFQYVPIDMLGSGGCSRVHPACMSFKNTESHAQNVPGHNGHTLSRDYNTSGVGWPTYTSPSHFISNTAHPNKWISYPVCLNGTPQPWIHFCTSHHILLEGPLELHTSIALSHTLSHHHHLHAKELIGQTVVWVWITSVVNEY